MDDFSQPSSSQDPKTPIPNIRTMGSDVEDLFKQDEATIAGAISQEVLERRHAEALGQSTSRKILLPVLIVMLLSAVGIGVYFLIEEGPDTAYGIRTPSTVKPFFSIDRTEDISAFQLSVIARQIEHLAEKRETANTITHVSIKLNNKPVTLYDILRLYTIDIPAKLVPTFRASPVMTFIHHEPSGNSIGFVFETPEPERALVQMLGWEAKIAFDFRPLFFGKNIEHLRAFEDRTYRNIDWRGVTLASREDVAVGYGIFSARNLFLITTSESSMRTVIDRLLDTTR